MPGWFSANLAEKAHNPLHARALVFDDGKTTLAIVLVDNLGVAREAVDEAKFLASRRCGILPENILVSATHTHSAPPSNVTDLLPVTVFTDNPTLILHPQAGDSMITAGSQASTRVSRWRDWQWTS